MLQEWELRGWPSRNAYREFLGLPPIKEKPFTPETVEIDGETLVVERISTDDKPMDMSLDLDKVKTLKLDPDSIDISKEMEMLRVLDFCKKNSLPTINFRLPKRKEE